ncbi:MAG: VPLPA-CTERM sorting domain-containing protein [Gammaproteobacteria bacterium]|jgi:hypothetical protein|nr:VPLPA-CTERM sorting domain-containing protein [Gammaproteobacteria bacterium]
MNKLFRNIAGAAVTLLLSSAAQAASVSLVPSAAAVENGDVLAVQLALDAPDAAGSSPGAFHGIVVLEYDPALLSFDSFEFSAPAAASGPVLASGHGAGLSSIEVAFQNAFNVGTIGTFTFNVLCINGDVIDLTIRDADDFFGSFVNTVPTIQPLYPDFTGAAVNVVPIPAAVWLFMSALGLAAGVARRR